MNLIQGPASLLKFMFIMSGIVKVSTVKMRPSLYYISYLLKYLPGGGIRIY